MSQNFIHNLHLENTLKRLIDKGRECEWTEFKENNASPVQIGEYLSALSNSAFLADEPYGYLIYGVEDTGNVTSLVEILRRLPRRALA
jgi:predicted HTH transcriptional regulator